MPLTQEERAKRRLSIGGSDIGAIAGVSPHKSALQLYLQKLGLDDDDDTPDTDAQLFGHIFEEPTAQIYAIKHGFAIDSFAKTLVHPAYPFLTANPDRICLSAERLLEIKTTGAGGLKYWRDETNYNALRPPQHVVLQVNWYLGFLGWQDADAVLLNFAESHTIERYHEFPLGFDAELFDLQIKLAVDFWEHHVLAKVPPEADTAEDMADYLGMIHQKHSDDVLEATLESTQIASRLHHASAQAKHWHEQKVIEGNALKALIGGKLGIRGQDWVYTWKQTASGGVDWKSLALSKKPTDAEIKRFTKPGYRRPYFRYKDAEEN